MFKFELAFIIVPVFLALSTCKPQGPPPDVLKTQREALEKVKAVEGQLQQQAEEQKKVIDDAQR